MQYDFDTPICRRGTDSVKWHTPDTDLPMWVADMDFSAAPEIIAALRARLSHPIFGYSVIPEDWYGAYIGWWRDRHGFTMDRDGLLFCTGVVPAISSIIRKLTDPGDRVVIQTPVYNAFFPCIENHGCQALESPLRYENGQYAMDLDDLEKKLADPRTALMILCNPHNPVGRIWDRDTLARIGEMCARYGVPVISDEIHCDVTAPGVSYVPFASVSDACREISVTCIAPTKCFNLAGLHTAAVYVSDPRLRQRVNRALAVDCLNEPGTLATPAAIAAFTQGGPWLDAMRAYVFENRRIAGEFIVRSISSIAVVPGLATYLMWLDIGGVCGDSRLLADFIRRETGLYLTAGAIYGQPGSRFFRLNIACPRALLTDGLDRLRRGIDLYLRQNRG